MLSKQELFKYSKKRGIGLWQAEKEYLLALFLHLYYSRFDSAIFKGGTSFRFFNGLNRFSEDLDFVIEKPKIFERELNNSLDRFLDFGIKYEVKKVERFQKAFTALIRFNGPLYANSQNTVNAIRIDAGYRTGVLLKPEYVALNLGFVDIPPTMVKVMNIEERFAEKVSSLFTRTNARDWYDVFFYHKTIPLNAELVRKKIKKFEFKIISKTQFEKELNYLLSKSIDFEILKSEVLNLLKSNELIE